MLLNTYRRHFHSTNNFKMYKKLTATTTLAISISLLTGCASMNKAECINADWKQIGFEDALSGRPMSRISDHRSACAQHDIVPDQSQYAVTFDEGLKLIREIQEDKEEIGKLKAGIRDNEGQRAVSQNTLSNLRPPQF